MKKLQVLLTRKLHDFALKELQRRYRVFVHQGKIPMPKKLLAQKIRNVDGLVCFPYDIIDSDIIKCAQKLKVISTYSVGFDHIDIKAAREHQIKIGYTPEVLTNATADLTVGLILDLVRRISEGDRLIRKGDWRVIFGAYDYVGNDLEGKTLGVLGMGRIGQAVSERARAFGMKIVYHNRKNLPHSLERKLHARYVSFPELIKTSDIFSIHVPYTEQTEGMINKNVLKKMKKTALLVNTARGKIINEVDLVRALKARNIAGAALDVFEMEPIGRHHALTEMQNVVLTPHIGSSTAETRKKMAAITVQNLVLGLEGKKMIYSV